MADLSYESFPRVRNNYQVHLWDNAERKYGMLFSADSGFTESVVHDIAVALRLMTGRRSISNIISLAADSFGLEYPDAEKVIRSILEQFISEGVVENSLLPLPERNFSLPLRSQLQLSILQLQLTNMCNLQCPHCYAGSGKPLSNEMITNDVFNLIDEFVNLGGSRLFLTGGETLLYENLDAVISYAKSRHLFVYLSSNGFSITEERVNRLVNMGVGAVNISIDGDNELTHDTFRGRKGAYKKAIMALKLFSKKGIPCGSQTTLFTGNLAQSCNIFDSMHDMGVPNCFFVRMMPQGRGKDNLDLIPTMEEYETAREIEYLNRHQKYGLNIFPKKINNDSSGYRCSAGISQVYVLADGNCYPCPSLETKELCMGKYPENSLFDIWNNKKPVVNELREFEPENIIYCRNCKYFDICNGGCAGNAFHVTGDWRNHDPHFCVTMKIRERVQNIK